MKKNEMEKMIEDGVTQLCLNSNGVGCRQVLDVREFNIRRRQRKNESWFYTFEKLCSECQNRLARAQRLVQPKTINNPNFGTNNKKKEINHTGWLGLDRSFFIDVEPTNVEHISRYTL